MAFTVITSCLTDVQLNYLSTAMDSAFGEGVVDYSNYDNPSDLELIKRLRLDFSSPSVVLVLIGASALEGNFNNTLGKAIEKVREVDDSSSPKFLLVESNNALISFLNTTYALSIPLEEENSPVEETVAHTVVVEGISQEEYDRVVALLSAKDETIKALEYQVSELNSKFEFEVGEGSFDFPVSVTVEGNSVESDNTIELDSLNAELEGTKKNLDSKEKELDSLKVELADLRKQYALESGLIRDKDKVILELETKLDALSGINVEEMQVTIKELEGQVSSLKLEVSDKDVLLRSKDSELLGLNTKVQGFVSEIEGYKGKLSNYTTLLTKSNKLETDSRNLTLELEKAKSELQSVTQEKGTLESSLQDLRSQLDTERSTVISLNRRLMEVDVSTTSQYSDSLSDSLILPNSPMSEVWSNSYLEGWMREVGSPHNVSFSNISFVFSGSGDSQREAYLHAYSLLESRGKGIFFDISTENLSDYRFGTKTLKSAMPWVLGEGDLQSALSPTRLKDVYVLSATSNASYNDLSILKINLLAKLKELDSIGVPILVYGGTISNYLSRFMLSLATSPNINLGSKGTVDVISLSQGTSARAMYFNAKLVGGGARANYYLVGKLQDMTKMVLGRAKKEGFNWMTKEK